MLQTADSLLNRKWHNAFTACLSFASYEPSRTLSLSKNPVLSRALPRILNGMCRLLSIHAFSPHFLRALEVLRFEDQSGAKLPLYSLTSEATKQVNFLVSFFQTSSTFYKRDFGAVLANS